MITRDMIQGFIDGYKATGAGMDLLGGVLDTWLTNHPVYKSTDEQIASILTDLGSYRL